MSFWANAINGTQTETPPAPIQRGLYTYNNPIPQNYQYQPPQPDYIPAVTMTKGSICPGCNSDRYLAHPPGQPERTVSCGECGYHPRFEQTGYGTRSLRSEPGSATPARQASGGQTMQQSIAVLNAGGGEHIK